MKKAIYKQLSSLILRNPLYSLSSYNKIPATRDGLEFFFGQLYNDDVFREAIYIASPILFEQWEKDINKDVRDELTKRKLYKSLMKYYIRSVTNCVPFGLFASYSIINKDNTKPKADLGKFERFVDVKLIIIDRLIDFLKANNSIQNKILYYPNDTLHLVGDTYNYIEYKKDSNFERYFNLSEVQSDAVFELVISSCIDSPVNKSKLVDVIVNNVAGISYEEAGLYINQLIDSKILLSTLDLCVNSESPLYQLKYFLDNNCDNLLFYDEDVGHIKNLVDSFLECIKMIELNNSETDNIDKYRQMSRMICDLFPDICVNNIIDIDIKRTLTPDDWEVDNSTKLKKAIEILSCFSLNNPESVYLSLKNLDDFKRQFVDRYGESEVNLLEVLNNESGIGYANSESCFDEIINDLRLSNLDKKDVGTIRVDHKIDEFWYKTIYRACRSGQKNIDLKNEDLSFFNEAKKNILVGTFPVVYTVFRNNIYVISGGGTSSLLYLGRFTCRDAEMKKVSDEIVGIEQNIFANKILAEVIHIPSYTNGQVAMRNITRKYSIPVLNKSSFLSKKIKLDDLTLSIKNGKILLKNAVSNEEVIPFMSCAQNFHYGTLSIYHFLCDLQFESRPNLLSLEISPNIINYFDYIPRITYDNIVLSLARWNFTRAECASFLNVDNCVDYAAFLDFKLKHCIPRYIYLLEDASEPLVIDTENVLLLDFIADHLKVHKSIRFVECVYDFQIDDDAVYANEYIASFSSEPCDSNTDLLSKKEDVKRKFVPGDEWMYFKIYTGENKCEKILSTAIKQIIDSLYSKNMITRWFFIRFYDPDFHIRIRVNFMDNRFIGDIVSVFKEYLSNYLANKSIYKIEISTYDREIERYFGEKISDSEMIFCGDSTLVLNVLKELRRLGKSDLVWLYALKDINDILNTFFFSLDEKENIISEMYISFCEEFSAGKEVRRQIDLKFRKYYCDIDNVINNDLNCYYQDKANFIKPYVSNLMHSLSRKELDALLRSHIHMSINRFVRKGPRVYELFIYGILAKYYKKNVGKDKYVKKEVL